MQFLVCIWLGAVIASSDAPAAGAPPRKSAVPAFTDVTRESGVEAIVDDNYAAHPKWWLSGLHLVDLDGDGHLDLFLSAPRDKRGGGGTERWQGAFQAGCGQVSAHGNPPLLRLR